MLKTFIISKKSIIYCLVFLILALISLLLNNNYKIDSFLFNYFFDFQVDTKKFILFFSDFVSWKVILITSFFINLALFFRKLILIDTPIINFFNCLFIASCFNVFVVGSLKLCIGKLRPFVTEGVAIYSPFQFNLLDIYSFPSGHSAGLGVLVFSILFSTNFKYPNIAIAFIGFSIAFLRVVLNLHFLSDVVFSFLFSLSYSLISIYLYNFFATILNKFLKARYPTF